MAVIHADIRIKGIVQGVGFRPFIHRTVRACGLSGTVRNTSYGALVCLEGEESAVAQAVTALRQDAPPIALIEAVEAEMSEKLEGFTDFEILPSDDHYPMTYNELTDVAKREQNENARPAYAGEVPDLSQYSAIFIGAPVWWGDWPMILYTFFEANADALAGKTLIPFSTHAGSGLSGFDTKLARIYPDCTIGKGLATAGTDTQNNGTKSPEINTCTHSQLVYDKGNRIYNGKKITSLTSGAEETGQPQ